MKGKSCAPGRSIRATKLQIRVAFLRGAVEDPVEFEPVSPIWLLLRKKGNACVMLFVGRALCFVLRQKFPEVVERAC